MIKPLGQRFIVKLLEEKQESAGLIILKNQDPVVKALVIAIPKAEADIKIGDTVLAKRDCGVSCQDGLMIGKVDILAVVE